MMESILKTINSVNSANLLDKFLASSALSSLCSLIIAVEALPDNLNLV